jgi:hypothetical protein
MHRKKIAETLGCYVVRYLAGVFMKSLITVLVVATFVVALGSVLRANAARRSTPNYDQKHAPHPSLSSERRVIGTNAIRCIVERTR